MSYLYRAFGLNIISDFECPKLIPGDGDPDVYIRYASVPESLEDSKLSDYYFDLNAGQILIRINTIVRFLVSNGHEILVDREPDCDNDVMRLYLLGMGFAGLLLQRDLLPLHSNAVETSRGMVAFVGYTGIGKSTLAGALCRYRLYTDDILVLSMGADGVPVAYPGFPEMRMTPETAERLDVDTASAQKISWQKEKYKISMHEAFAVEPHRLYAIYWRFDARLD